MARRIRRGLSNFGDSLMKASQTMLVDERLRERQATENQAQLFQSVVGSALASQREREQQELIGKREEAQATRAQQLQELTSLLKGVQAPNSAADIPTDEVIMNTVTRFPDRAGDVENLLQGAKAQRSKFQLQAEDAQNREIATESAKVYDKGVQENRLANETLPDVLKRLTQTGTVEAQNAGKKAGAESAARIAVELKNAEALRRVKVADAEALIPVMVAGERQKAFAKSVMDARATGQQALGKITQLRELWDKAEPEIKQASMGSNMGAGLVENAPMVLLATSPNARLYYEKRESMLPEAAKLGGEVGNLAELEQDRARYVFPNAYDAVAGTASEKWLRQLAVNAIQADIAVILHDPRNDNLTGPQKFKLIDQKVNETMQVLRNEQGTNDRAGRINRLQQNRPR